MPSSVSSVCVFAPSAFVACLIACATVCVHLPDQTTRRHRTNYIFPKTSTSTSLFHLGHQRTTSQYHLSHLSLDSFRLPTSLPPYDGSILKHRPHKRIPNSAAVLHRQLPSPHPHRPSQHHPLPRVCHNPPLQ